jgi:uncharacterized protein (TIGR03435 family)
MRRTAGILCLTIALPVGGQSPARLEFEVASIKRSDPSGRGGGISPLPGGQTYRAQGAPVKLIFRLMYRLTPSQVSGGPGWLDTELYDIEAKAAKPSTLDELHVMFQNLLADQFRLQFHKETRELPVYALVQDKSGSKMKVNEAGDDFKISIDAERGGKFVGTRVAMPYLSWWLSGIVARDGRPVIDKTELDKHYDFTLSFAPEFAKGAPIETPPEGMLDRPNIFDALKEQLGLKLEPQKGPVDIYVIDRAERPSAN